MHAEILDISRRHTGVAGQYAYVATVQYPGEPAKPVTFVSNTYATSIYMVTETMGQIRVVDPGRFGAYLSPDWIRRFFANLDVSRETNTESIGNVDAFIVKDRVSGVTVINHDGTVKTFTRREDAERFVVNVSHYVNTDYYVVELDAFN